MPETETRVDRRFDVWNEVPLVPQLTGMSCWAAAAAMVIGWRDSLFVDPQQVASGSGTWEAYRAGLHPGDVDALARAWGLTQERRDAWTVEALRGVLARFGPVWLGEASPGLHSIVVAGMHGDGTPEGTWVRVNDPWPVGKGERYTLPWSTLAANFRRAGDLIGVQAHVLHAGGRRGSSRTRVAERRVTRSRISLPARTSSEDAMIYPGNGRARHPEEYESATGPEAVPVPGGDPYGFVEAMAVDDDVRAWLAAAPSARAPLASAVAAWIADTSRSGIELIADAARRRHFLSGVDWSRTDFPGNDQDRSAEPDALFAALTVPVPERRVTAIRYRDVDSVVQPVPGETRFSLFPEAKAAYLRMRDAARADGVTLRIGSAWRSLAAQRAAAARNPNASAVAQRVSAHSYGLAVDLLLSVPGLPVREITTRPMANVIAMYRSPVYKWMALRAREFGFFPYRREPWHWEYNPDGFRARFEGAGGSSAGRSAAAHAYGAPIGLLERYGPAEALQAAAAPDLTGPLSESEWRSVAHWLARGEIAVKPLTGDAAANATLVAGAIFCERMLYARTSGEDPLLCVVDDVTHRDPRVRALVARVTARGPIVHWPRVSPDDRFRYVMNRLVTQYGFPVNGAAGAVGNLWAESALIPSRIQASGEATPMRGAALEGGTKDFSPDEVMNRDERARRGPRIAGIGLAQWTDEPRRGNLFRHAFRGRVVGSAILFDMDAQIDYMVTELRTRFAGVHRLLTTPGVSLNDASDEFVYNYERPKKVLENGRQRPRADAQVQEVFRQRRNGAQRALRLHQAARPAAAGQAYGAPLGLFERYPSAAALEDPASVAVPIVRADGALALQAAPAPAVPPIDWCDARKAAAVIAEAEERVWTRNGAKAVESNPLWLPSLERYWSAVPGVNAVTAARLSAQNHDDWPWSAAFICYVMFHAGVRRAHGFHFGAAHIHYIVGALRNRERSDGPLWLHDAVEIRSGESAVGPGDLLCMNRLVDGVMTTHSYESLRRAFWRDGDRDRSGVAPSGSSHCTVVVRIVEDAQGRFLETVGGNENQSVRRNNYGRIPLNADGGIANPAAHNIFGAIKSIAC